MSKNWYCFRLLEFPLPRTAPWSRKRSKTLKSWWRRPRGTERRWRNSGRSYGNESWSSSRERCAKSAPRNEVDSWITSCFTVAPHQVASRETGRQEAPKRNPEGRLLSSSLVLRGGATPSCRTSWSDSFTQQIKPKQAVGWQDAAPRFIVRPPCVFSHFKNLLSSIYFCCLLL